mmetsp:Transcript_31837/g.74277  ORF Transcript_31837/g.74277 Transcript_31837/m.74277 type:complete len:286 (-) Transcript_31837:659-1516(-)
MPLCNDGGRLRNRTPALELDNSLAARLSTLCKRGIAEVIAADSVLEGRRAAPHSSPVIADAVTGSSESSGSSICASLSRASAHASCAFLMPACTACSASTASCAARSALPLRSAASSRSNEARAASSSGATVASYTAMARSATAAAAQPATSAAVSAAERSGGSATRQASAAPASTESTKLSPASSRAPRSVAACSTVALPRAAAAISAARRAAAASIASDIARPNVCALSAARALSVRAPSSTPVAALLASWVIGDATSLRTSVQSSPRADSTMAASSRTACTT